MALNGQKEGEWDHFLLLEKLIDELNSKKINGAIAECGVWKGGASMWMMLAQKKR